MIARRKFLAGAGAAGGMLVAGALMPVSILPVPTERGELPAAEEAWHVDDMWGHLPRYAEAIPHAGVAHAPVTWEHWDPIDHMLMI